jgi:hypothetical protein
MRSIAVSLTWNFSRWFRHWNYNQRWVLKTIEWRTKYIKALIKQRCAGHWNWLCLIYNKNWRVLNKRSCHLLMTCALRWRVAASSFLCTFLARAWQSLRSHSVSSPLHNQNETNRQKRNHTLHITLIFMFLRNRFEDWRFFGCFSKLTTSEVRIRVNSSKHTLLFSRPQETFSLSEPIWWPMHCSLRPLPLSSYTVNEAHRMHRNTEMTTNKM